MRSLRMLFWVGIVLCILPYLGIPRVYKQPLYVLTGVIVLYASFHIRSKYVPDIIPYE